MKKILISILLLTLPISAIAATTFVKGKITVVGGTTCNEAFTTSTTAGDALILWVHWGSGTATTTAPTDDAGNTWTKLTNIKNSNQAEAWYVQNAAATLNVTTTFSASISKVCSFLDFTGAALTSLIDATSTDKATSTSGSASSTTTNANDMLIGLFAANSQETWTVSSDYVSSTSNGNTLSDLTEYRYVTSTATYTATTTLSTSTTWMSTFVSIKDATGGANTSQIVTTGPTIIRTGAIIQ